MNIWTYILVKLAFTVVEKTNRPNPIFHTKLSFVRGFLETKTIKNYLILQRVKRYIQGEHKLKFWLRNIHKFQNCYYMPNLWFHLLPNKNRSFYQNTSAVLKFVNIFETNFRLCSPCTLQTFSLQKLQVFTVSKFPLQFHCIFCSQSMHAVDHCSQLKHAFIAVK